MIQSNKKYDVLNIISGDCFVVVVVVGRGAGVDSPTRNEYYLHNVACRSKKKPIQPENFDHCTCFVILAASLLEK